MRLLHYTNGKQLDQRGSYEDYVVIQRDDRTSDPPMFGFSLHCETELSDVGANHTRAGEVDAYDSDHLPVGTLRLGPVPGACCE